MILVDSSVWIEHFRQGSPELVRWLEEGLVLVHPVVIGELACGRLSPRGEILELLANLPSAQRASDAEVLALIEGRALMGRGIGYVDAHLLASTLISAPARLWTLDRRLTEIAAALGVALHAAPPRPPAASAPPG